MSKVASADLRTTQHKSCGAWQFMWQVDTSAIAFSIHAQACLMHPAFTPSGLDVSEYSVASGT